MSCNYIERRYILFCLLWPDWFEGHICLAICRKSSTRHHIPSHPFTIFHHSSPFTMTHSATESHWSIRVVGHLGTGPILLWEDWSLSASKACKSTEGNVIVMFCLVATFISQVATVPNIAGISRSIESSNQAVVVTRPLGDPAFSCIFCRGPLHCRMKCKFQQVQNSLEW